MHSIKRIFDFILFGNIYIALGTVCLIQSSIIQLGLPDYLYNFALLAFFATLFVYNLQRIFYKTSPKPSQVSVRRAWIAKNQMALKILAALGLVGVTITFFLNDYSILQYLSPLLVLCLLYFIPSIKLRKNPWLKLLTLVSVWTMVTSVVPLLISNSEFNINSLLHVAVRFWFMMAICIPFDIRDLQIDKTDAVVTIPHLVGENKARWIAFGCMIIYGTLIIPEYLSGMIGGKIFTALMLSALINSLIVLMSSTKRSEYFYVAGIDGTMLLQGILLLIATRL